MNFIDDCGIMVEPQEGMAVDELLDVARYAEKSGFGYFFRSDHLLPTSRKKGLDSPECWTTLGAVAARTSTIKLGTMVSPIGFRNPALLARMACTVNSIARGRLRLGVGAGWYRDEYLAHGFRFPNLEVRKAQFREALEIIRPLTQSGRVDFEGKYFAAHLGSLPKLKKPVHLIIGGRLRSLVRQTEEFGDEWNFFSQTPDKFDEMKEELDSSGRRIEISRMGWFVIGESETKLATRLRREMKEEGAGGDLDAYVRSLRKQGVLVGTGSEFADQVNALRGRGVGKFYFQVWDTGDREQIDLLRDLVRGM